MEKYYVTITGMNHYLGMKPYKVNRLVKLVKEPENPYDPEAIRVELPYIDTIGYVANSTYTVFAGTYSASRLYDRFEDYGYAQVMFITHSSVIAAFMTKEEAEETDMPDAGNGAMRAGTGSIGAPRAKIGF